MKPLKICPAFEDLIPPLSDDEFRGLEESILSHGRCRDTIKVWKDTIVDGHNRYAICIKHGLPYGIQEMRFSSRNDAKLWIVQNQLGRRNLVSAMRIKLVQLYGFISDSAGLLNYENGMPQVQKKLKSQLKAIKALCK